MCKLVLRTFVVVGCLPGCLLVFAFPGVSLVGYCVVFVWLMYCAQLFGLRVYFI